MAQCIPFCISRPSTIAGVESESEEKKIKYRKRWLKKNKVQ